MIEQHKGKNDNSILSKLLIGSELGGDENPVISKEELLANLWLLFRAGHETTANALTMECNCLGVYPEIQEKIYEEIKEKIGLQKIPTEKDLNELIYLDCFIQEVLRLHTAIPLLPTRIAVEDVKYKNMIIPKGSRVGIFTQAIHINPDYWEDPMVFRPERFLPENKKNRNHFSHVPFSAGLRQCIGTNFTLLEQRLFLTRLIQKYQVVSPLHSKAFGMDEHVPLGKAYSAFIHLRKRIPNSING